MPGYHCPTGWGKWCADCPLNVCCDGREGKHDDEG
jgi:hypothetical protein